MPNRNKSILLVALQFGCITILLAGSSFHKPAILPAAFFVPAVLLAVWAIVTMQESKLRIFPEPAAHAVLITNGPYRFIRHPMYTAVILGSTGLLMSHFTILRMIILLALTAVLIFKLIWEEDMLLRKFEAYQQYRCNTSRLVPFLF